MTMLQMSYTMYMLWEQIKNDLVNGELKEEVVRKYELLEQYQEMYEKQYDAVVALY